jgi:hypothetical protein
MATLSRRLGGNAPGSPANFNFADLFGARQIMKKSGVRIMLTGMSTLLLTWASGWSHGRAASPDDADFEPIIEASMPTGFPTYTPVGTVELKSYPAYRMAQANGGRSFWTLFSHIKSNKIAMTAPVQLDYASGQGQSSREMSMAFLYGDPALGTAGRQGRVDVVDVPAAEVVSIGVRGQRTNQKVSEAEARLRQWIADQSAYTPDGDLRVMAYNSPFVPRDRQFFEVQIPVRKP